MRKNFGAKAHICPQPVFMVASYDENGNPDVMNAAWGCVADYDKIALYLASSHKTVQNILKRHAFTVSMATEETVDEADYVGMVSANQVSDKVERAHLHVMPSEFVDAPMIVEFSLTFECEWISYDPDSELLLGKVVNMSAQDSILDEQGKVDPLKLRPILFDAMNHTYLGIKGIVGQAFHDGLKIKDKEE